MAINCNTCRHKNHSTQLHLYTSNKQQWQQTRGQMRKKKPLKNNSEGIMSTVQRYIRKGLESLKREKQKQKQQRKKLFRTKLLSEKLYLNGSIFGQTKNENLLRSKRNTHPMMSFTIMTTYTCHLIRRNPPSFVCSLFLVFILFLLHDHFNVQCNVAFVFVMKWKVYFMLIFV